MDSMNLKDFRPDQHDFDSDEPEFNEDDAQMTESGYHEEINTLKIDKLSNKITIISIIIPVMIGAILAFAYLDMKERVVDVDQTKQSQVDQITMQLEEKLNALDVKIAKNRFDLENSLPDLQEKNIALEGQLSKLNTTKADNKKIQADFSKLNKKVTANAASDKTILANMDKIGKKTTAAIASNQSQFEKTAKQIKNEITLFKEEFDARLLELSDYEQQIGLLRKDLSLLDKKFKRMEQAQVSQADLTKETDLLKKDIAAQKKTFAQQLVILEDKLAADIIALKKKMGVQKSSAAAPVQKPKPQVNIEPTLPNKVSQQPLAQ